ncbi:hypothetical protein [Centipeda periodontii]
MLFTGIDTAVPGQVTAQVSADVYDSLTQCAVKPRPLGLGI